MTHTTTRPMELGGFEFDFSHVAPTLVRGQAWQVNETARLIACVFASNADPLDALLREDLVAQAEEATRSTRHLRMETDLDDCNWRSVINELIGLHLLETTLVPGAVQPSLRLMQAFRACETTPVGA